MNEPGKRLTLSQILELMLSRGGRDHSSVTLTRNSKGDTQIEVVVRTGDSDDVLTIEAVAAKAREVYEQLREQYPHSGSNTAPTVID